MDADEFVAKLKRIGKSEDWVVDAALALDTGGNAVKLDFMGATDERAADMVDKLLKRAGKVAAKVANKIAAKVAAKIAAKLAPALRQQTVRWIAVTASHCSFDTCKTIDRMIPERFSYHGSCAVPCCLVSPPTPYTPEPFTWPRPDELDAPENTVSALKWLEENLAPAGVTVLPVQGISWLDRTVDFSPTTSIAIQSASTGYIFVEETTWADCQAQFGATVVEGHELHVADGCASDALEFMLPGIVGLYTVTADTVTGGLMKLRTQALLQYLAVNDMRGWPKRDVVVVYGDLRSHNTVHAGRKPVDRIVRMPSLHVAWPAIMTDAAGSSPDSVTVGFIRALLCTPRTVAAPWPWPSGGAA
ncbi:hypothetical protein GPECTOR_10g1127 [Gonium pectorale]|uniref:Uncharacterized protein n=1 Tax=Gonium pectorale TaxID=33097 RepID=A0A150GQN8_GONPE|nr:hypothetical protein GPECTOR_10g1127 [Gonium pectorale]|eukprot:KXZ52104.1 hypothetical protein GPECTOR_10g1127 [Gonium pectorale]